MKKYTDIKIGDEETLHHTITQNDVDKFVELTGDNNRLHVDEDFALSTQFKKPIAHGMLTASFISTLIGTKLPGDGAVWFSQTLEFLQPVHVSDQLHISAVVIKKNDRDQIIELKIEIKNQYKQLITKGLSKVKIVKVSQNPKLLKEKKVEKIALVIGGTGSIGRAVCKQLAMDGFHTFIHYHSNKKLAETLMKEIISGYGKAFILKADVTKEAEIYNLHNSFKRYYDKLDVLVNCSSTNIPNISLKNLCWADVNEQINFHVKSVFEITQSFESLLRNGYPGKVINLGTLATDIPNSNWLHYITAKSALLGLTKAMAFELGPKGITVNLVSPGLIESDSATNLTEKLQLITASQTPLRKLGTVHDVVNTISFLASDKSNFLTGQNIRINGGQFSI